MGSLGWSYRIRPAQLTRLPYRSMKSKIAFAAGTCQPTWLKLEEIVTELRLPARPHHRKRRSLPSMGCRVPMAHYSIVTRKVVLQLHRHRETGSSAKASATLYHIFISRSERRSMEQQQIQSLSPRRGTHSRSLPQISTRVSHPFPTL